MSVFSKLRAGLTSPWSIAFSIFGIGYGTYHIIGTTQAGKKYEFNEDLSGKTYIVTGATSGLGKVAAEELAKRQARVIMACRDREKCIHVRRDIVLATRNKQVYCRRLDLEDFDNVQNFVENISKGKHMVDSVDGLINNAATMEKIRSVNKLGIEKTMATNYMGTFLLTGLLIDKFLKQDNNVRIVFLNTNIIKNDCKIDFDDLNIEKQKFDGFNVYKKSKLAVALFAKELSERLKNTNISVLMADPGRCKTNLSTKYESDRFFLSRWILKPFSYILGERSPEKGVKPILCAIADPILVDVNGTFLDRERNKQSWPEDCDDVTLRKKLWITTEQWTKFYDHLKKINTEMNKN
ncbi:Dehydrogenase/reductase SDR family member 12 [Strongyloides ratti]|uniref:Dehydrogenase/reductase SDR family member 12 n=1 Tax=Strongyloides ratti TaxID=34506 RepID=A0A090KYP5_STRRB|nr:Dehydrogenase/reductase SDR family member 12 [Strongyloides ratti]CEF61007.1 Dehydrogenase/reductase SDR family member 12 [Strongyloides ratti]